MESSDNAYEVLGLEASATSTQIKKAYRTMALKFHPDRQSTEEDKKKCQHVFAKLSHAYEILSDDEERERYDKKLKEAEKPAAKPKKAPFPQPSKTPAAAKTATPPSSSSSPSKSKSGGGTSPKPAKQKKKVPKSQTMSKQTPQVEKSWQERTDDNAAKEWGFALGTNNDNPLLMNGAGYDYTPTKGFHDPYEVFKKVFREEFGEDYKPGLSTKESKAARNRPNAGRGQVTLYEHDDNSKMVKSDKKNGDKKKKMAPNNPSAGWDEPDNRPVAMRMETRQNVLPNNQIETITTTYITRPDGKVETVVKSSVDGSDHNPLLAKKKNANSSDDKKGKSQSGNSKALVSANPAMNTSKNKQKKSTDIVIKKTKPNKKGNSDNNTNSTALVPVSDSDTEGEQNKNKRASGFLGRFFGKKKE